MAFGAVLFAPKGDGFFGIGAEKLGEGRGKTGHGGEGRGRGRMDEGADLFAQAGMAGGRVERGPNAVAVVAVELAELLRLGRE